MKKTFIIICMLFLIAMNLYRCDRNIKYPAGRDTRESFGDGTYQILRDPQKLYLSNEEFNTILMEVTSYCTRDNKIYIIGKTEESNDIQYVIIDIINNTMEMYCNSTNVDITYYYRMNEMINEGVINIVNSIDDFSDDDLEILEALKDVN